MRMGWSELLASIALTEEDAYTLQDESNPEYYESATKHQCQPEQKDNFDVPTDSTSQSRGIAQSTHRSPLSGCNRARESKHRHMRRMRKARVEERSKFNELRRVLGEHTASNEKVLTIAQQMLLELKAEYARRH